MQSHDHCSGLRWIAAVLFLAPLIAHADSSIQLASRALGNGQFEYDVTVRWNAFFSDFYGVKFGGFPFTNFTGGTASDGATPNVGSNGVFDVNWPGTWPTPATRTAWAQSGAPYVTTSNYGFVMFAAIISGWMPSPYGSLNIVGYVRLPILIPSAEFDSNVTSFATSTNYVIIPDPAIVDATPSSLTFKWYTNATFGIEAARAGGGWTNVAIFLHDAPQSTWTSSVPLSDLGDRFRGNLLANHHDTNLVAKAPTVSPAPDEAVPVLSAIPSESGWTRLTLATEPGRAYEVSLQDERGATLDLVSFTATDKRTAVTLQDGGTAGVVLIRAKRMP